MKVYIVGSYVFTDKEAADAHAKVLSLGNEMGGGYGNTPSPKETEIEGIVESCPVSLEESKKALHAMTVYWGEHQLDLNESFYDWEARIEDWHRKRDTEWHDKWIAENTAEAMRAVAKEAKLAAEPTIVKEYRAQKDTRAKAKKALSDAQRKLEMALREVANYQAEVNALTPIYEEADDKLEALWEENSEVISQFMSKPRTKR